MAEQVPATATPVNTRGSSVVTASGFLLAIGVLYFGREFFIPFTLAVLLAFALSPIVSRLKRWRVPRAAAVIIAVTFAFCVIAGLSYVVTTQLIKLADAVPSYRQTMIEKVRSLKSTGAGDGGIVERVTSTIAGLGRELTGPDTPAEPVENHPAGSDPAPAPVPVTIAEGEPSPFDVLAAMLGPLVEILATAGIVVVFVIFVLLEKEELRDRFIKLVGAGDLQTTTEAIVDAGTRVSRYLLMQLIVNLSYGLPIGIGLYLIGVPNAVLWGLLAAILRFIPFLGPFLAALFPLVLAFVVDPGWSMLFWVAGLFLVMELISNNVLEPWLYGASTGLSSLAVISAAIFWTSLWGPIGLILSTPLTVCLVVIGRYVPQMQFLGVLLGSDPVLTPQEKLYQRLLAGNAEGATELAETYTDEHSFEQFYDEVAIPALRLAENDRQRNIGDEAYKRTVAEGMVAVVHEVTDHARQRARAERAKSEDRDRAPRPVPADGVPDLCVAGRTDLDTAAAEMVAHAVGVRGFAARVLPSIAISQNGIGQIDLAGVEVVCLSYLASEPTTFAKFACRRLKRRSADIKIIVCLWNPTPALRQAGDLREQLGADAVAFSLDSAAAQIETWITPRLSDPMQPAPIPQNEQERIAALRDLGLATGEGRHFNEVAAKVAAAFEMPIALVTIIDEEHQIWPGAVGLPAKLDACRMGARETSICGHVVAANETLVIPDVSKDARFANNPFLIENGIRFYAGTPLRTSSGFVIGSLCVIDIKPRSFGEAECKILRRIADDLMVRVELDCHRARTRGPLGGPLPEDMPEEIRRPLARL